jgi:LCP family protein required for cell wall assembly
VPLVTKRPTPTQAERDGRYRYRGPKPPRPPRRANWRRRILIAVLILALLLVAWAVASYLALRSGVKEANERLPPRARAALVPQDGLLLSKPSYFLLLGTDHSRAPARAVLQHSDSIMLVRTDPDRHRLTYLSIPRDLRVVIPGRGANKINTAFQLGGAALAIRTVRTYTGLPVNHVVIVDFADFRDLIDAVGGITVNVPAKIVSNRFDCPYAPSRCSDWPGWTFEKGPQKMNGRRALVYARIRENRLNPTENDLSRGERQQKVVQALTGKLTSVGTLAKMPFIGDDLLEPLATDLTTEQFMQLFWLRFRASSDRALHCRLGGTASFVGGQSVILPTEENFAVIHMVAGTSAPQPPPPGSGPFGPGCVEGDRRLD